MSNNKGNMERISVIVIVGHYGELKIMNEAEEAVIDSNKDWSITVPSKPLWPAAV